MEIKMSLELKFDGQLDNDKFSYHTEPSFDMYGYLVKIKGDFRKGDELVIFSNGKDIEIYEFKEDTDVYNYDPPSAINGWALFSFDLYTKQNRGDIIKLEFEFLNYVNRQSQKFRTRNGEYLIFKDGTIKKI